MKRKRRWLFYPLIIVALLLCATPAYAEVPTDIPTIPHAFYGTVTINDSAAEVGTVVTAKVGGVQCGSITTTVEGQYGGSGAFDEKLLVSGDIATGATISFFVNGVDTTQTYAFSPGGVTELNLTVTITDNTAPSVTITALTPDPTNDNTPTFTGTATDTESNISSVEYKIGAGSWTAATASDGAFDSLSEGYTFTTTTLADGAYTVYVRATDSYTNTTAEADYASDSFTVDTAAPSVTITALTPDPTTDTTPTFTGTATDTLSNISSVEYKVDAGSWTLATASDGAFDSTSEGYTFTTSALSDGAHTVYVRATDSATNTTAAANYASDSFTVAPPGAPSVTSTSPVADATDVATYTTVTATFDMAMDESTITTSSFTLDSVSGSVSYDSGTYTATFTPTAKLDSNTTYTAMLSTAITNAGGNPLAAAYSWSFTTVYVGDANCDGAVNALDITKVERIIAGLDPAVCGGADANQDGNINALDITKTERIIAGLD